jgi:hypothetical protein
MQLAWRICSGPHEILALDYWRPQQRTTQRICLKLIAVPQVPEKVLFGFCEIGANDGNTFCPLLRGICFYTSA